VDIHDELTKELATILIKFNSTVSEIRPGCIRVNIPSRGKVIELTYRTGNGAKGDGCRLEQIVQDVLSQHGFELVSFTRIS